MFIFLFKEKKEIGTISQTQLRMQSTAPVLGTYEVMEIEKTITLQAYGNHKDLGFVYI